jgi:hypothetical protein
MNIVGEDFNQEIAKQVIQRQKIYGSINRSNEELTYLNARTGWCKLMSGVSVNPAELNTFANIRNLNIPAGKFLAQNHVLWNGVTSFNTENNTFWNNQGIATDKSVFNDGAYGFGGLELGIRPMPGIISAEIKTETRGSIKKATVKIQANNRTQFDIIDLLYMRLGYSVLLEWGQSSYFNNDGTYIKKNPYSLAIPWFTEKYATVGGGTAPLTYDSILRVIKNYRLASCGNYDAIFAKVVNFSWNFTNEGKYDITINLISLGDVIESLKANTLLGKTEAEIQADDVKAIAKEEFDELVTKSSAPTGLDKL